jgi:hypothetical protein
VRARSVKPSLFKNELLGAADPLFTVVFEGLWCIADREGRLEDRPLRIHVEVNPYRDSASTVQALDWLVQHGFVLRYSAGSEKYLAIVNFSKHQQPHIKEAASKIPAPTNQGVTEAPDKHSANTSVAALTPDSGLPIPDSGLLTVGNAHTNDQIVPRQTIPFSGWEFIDKRMRPVYPRGTFRHTHWLNAARMVEQIVEEGADPELIAANAEAYRLQIEAKGDDGTKFVLAPTNFLADGNWRGPFELPAIGSKPKTETAMDRIYAATAGRGDDLEAIEHAH